MNSSSINFDSNTRSNNFNWKYAFSASTNRLSYRNTLIFRALNALLFMATFIYTISDFANQDCMFYWFMYATNWTQCLVTVYAITGVALTLNLKDNDYQDFGNTEESRKMPWFIKLHWAIQDSALVMSMIVTILTWYGCLILNEGVDDCSVDKVPTTPIVHGYNLIFMMLDIYITKQPFILLHGIYPIIISSSYFAWTYIHHLLRIGTCWSPNSNAPLYGSFTWGHGIEDEETKISILIVFVLILVPLLNCFYWFVYYTRLNTEITISIRSTNPTRQRVVIA
jgi:hypothetical protein